VTLRFSDSSSEVTVEGPYPAFAEGTRGGFRHGEGWAGHGVRCAGCAMYTV